MSLSIRQVFESNVPGNGPPGTDVTDGWSAPPSAASPAHSSGPIETEPSAAELAAYANLDCSDPANQKADPSRDDPTTFVAVCGAPDGSNVWYKYLLHPTLIAGPEVASAAAAYDDIGGAGWTVQLTFTSGAANTWSSFTARHIGTLTAIVLDGDVVSAEVIEGEITGPTQITGNFTKQQATALAKALKEGAASR